MRLGFRGAPSSFLMSVMTRTRRTLIAAAATLSCFLPTVGRAAIFDRDDRQYVRPTSIYSPVGLVSHETFFVRYWGTGFLVDDCHVLTSQGGSHLGYGAAPLGKKVKFQTGIGTPQHKSSRAVVIAAGETPLQRGGDQVARNWLLLRLDKCLGASVGHVALSSGGYSPFEFRDLKTAGYPAHRSRKRGLTVDPSCTIIGGYAKVWLNDCALDAGDGGTPIYRFSASATNPQMIVYAMQAGGISFGRKPVPLKAGYANQAIPMRLIAPQIQRYLSIDVSKHIAAR